MATTLFRDLEVHTVGELPAPGAPLPAFTLTKNDLGELTSDDLRGSRVVLNIFPSVDTGVCAASVRRFNELAAGLDGTVVVCASQDLPFALGRFCGAEGIADVVTGSGFRSSFADDFGVRLVDGPLRGLCARAVVVADADGIVRHVELVPQIGQEPDYEAALAALG